MNLNLYYKVRILFFLHVFLDRLNKRLILTNRGVNDEGSLHRKPIYQAQLAMKWCQSICQHNAYRF